MDAKKRYDFAETQRKTTLFSVVFVVDDTRLEEQEDNIILYHLPHSRNFTNR